MPKEVMAIAEFVRDCELTRLCLHVMHSNLAPGDERAELRLKLRMAITAVDLAAAGCKMVAEEYEKRGGK
jgi:hypothetical protein